MHDKKFISAEIERLLKNDLIEASSSPWRAQPFVVTPENHRKRMVIDYSQTINKFTQLNAYPLPRMQDVVNSVAQYSVYSTLDMSSAYHQVELPPSDRLYTAFQADGSLWQWKRIPLGLSNAVPVFQRIIDDIIKTNGCKGTVAYLDNITVGGKTQKEHDENLSKFLKVARDCNLTFNESKCVYSTDCVKLLGYQISKGTLKPDPDRVKTLLELPPPTNSKEQQRVVGLFAYYAQWISQYSDKVKPLLKNCTFPLSNHALKAFDELKAELAEVSLGVIDETAPFVVETDASNFALSATLNQNNRPVAFFSRTLHKTELNHSSVEKEAAAIVEAIRKWNHLLTGRRFKLITDQRSIAFMYDNKNHGKLKNAKILRWRIELSQFDYEIVYRAGKFNMAPDTLSRVYCASVTLNYLHHIHCVLCHPGVTRMYHYVRAKNLPYSLDEIRKMTANCNVCAEVKPRFIKTPETHLIKATQPMERLSLDFKGPIAGCTRYRYMLTVVDEFSRFPFAFPCSSIDTDTVINCLSQLFSMFGFCAFIHSDRGPAFMSDKLKSFLLGKGIGISRTSVYNPQGNGQCEKFNHTIWCAVKLAVKNSDLPISNWHTVLPEALHSIRSLLCTATNETPHERFLKFNRRSMLGSSMPTWLHKPGPVLLKRHVRLSKYEPLVDQVELIHATPSYARVRLANGREVTVSLRDVAPVGDKSLINRSVSKNDDDEVISNEICNDDSVSVDRSEIVTECSDMNVTESGDKSLPVADDVTPISSEPRRSSRVSRPPDRFTYDQDHIR